MADVALKVNGVDYAGWQSVRVTRGIKSVSGSFELAVSEKWSSREPWPVREGDQCEVSLEGQPVIIGFVDSRTVDLTADTHSLSVAGRDATGDLVDSSCLLAKWEYRGVDLLTFASRICAQFSIPVSVRRALELIKPAKFTIDPGDSAFEALSKACRHAGVLPIADGKGGLLLTRPGAERATTALVQGQNIKVLRAVFSASDTFARYVALGQHPGSNTYWGKPAAGVKGEATDANVDRAGRVLVIRPDGALTAAGAKVRAQWEATVRSAKADAVTAHVQGWAQKSGALWPINAKVAVKSELAGVDGDMLITQATYSIDDQGGTTTELALERPDAYLPEPTITTKSTAKFKPFWEEKK